MATNFNTTGLADFTAANPQKALQLVILEGIGTKDAFDFETGVKYQTKVPYINNVDIDVSTGAIAGYNNGSGQTTTVDIILSNIQLKVYENYTKEQLNKTILASLGKKGTDPSELPMEDILLTLKTKQLHATNEKIIWQADTSTSVQTAGSTLNSFDGILAQMRAGAGGAGTTPVNFNTDAGITDASILKTVNSFYTKMSAVKPEYVMIDTVLAMSPSQFAAYSRALYNLNGTVTTQTIGADGKPVEAAYIPGTKTKVVPMIGLNGKNNLLLTIPQNIIVAYDLESEDEALELWYNKAAHRFDLEGQYKLGVKVVDPSNCIFA
jgi:hypothetical protein